MKKISALLLPCFLFLVAGAQNQPPKSPCAADAVYRQFDFWIGEWIAYAPNGNKAGVSKIQLILDSCVILENWTSEGAPYSGKSFNLYNSATKKWQQTWVDSQGSITNYSDGHFENNQMILQTADEVQPDGSHKILKMTFTKIDGNTVRQFGESSTDGGKTWSTDFDLKYVRSK